MMTTSTTTAKKVLLGLSGGVDSSLCAKLLQDAGYEVIAAYLDLSPAHASAIERARKVAEDLKIEFMVIREHDLFLKEVITPFCHAYRDGKTPNPCITCNPTVKFKLLHEKAKNLGCDFIATGHYADVIEIDGYYYPKKASDIKKDQSYMLYRLPQHILKTLKMPLNSLTKEEVRTLAEQGEISTANTPDSQEICFVPDNDYKSYVDNFNGGAKQGFFVSPEGERFAKHKGITHYTQGQRKGLGVALGQPVFVRKIDPISGDIFLVYKGDELSNGCFISDLISIGDELFDEKSELSVKIRSVAKPIGCSFERCGDDSGRLIFDRPQHAAANGQSAVIYCGDRIVGGGIICDSF